VYSFNWFKSRLTDYLFHDRSPQTEDIDRTNYCSGNSYCVSKLYFECECRPDNWNSSAINRNCTGYSGYSNGVDIFRSGIEFFIDAKRQHYDVLNRYTFKALVQLSPPHRRESDDILPTYNNAFPINAYKYGDAVLHMRKDKGNMHLDIANYQKLLVETNGKNAEGNNRINDIIMEELEKAGYQDSGTSQADEIEQVKTWSKSYLNQALKAQDTNDYANKLDPNLGALGISEKAKIVIRIVCTNHEILDLLDGCKKSENGLTELANIIVNKSSSLVIAIESKDYDIDADCCPTYWTLLSRFV
jgi:hypothetical protein